jgi:hypothetical protein
MMACGGVWSSLEEGRPGGAQKEIPIRHEFFARYQRYADEAYANVQSRLSRGSLTLRADLPESTQIGSLIDRAARARLRLYLRSEFGAEGAGRYGQVNRWLRDPTVGSSAYRIPDSMLPDHIFDLTIGTKTWATPQIMDFYSFSGGSRITIVRPQALGGSYSLWR